MIQVDLPYDRIESIDELKDSEDNWTEFFGYCIDLAASNFNYILQRGRDDFIRTVEPDIVQMIIERNM